MNSLNIKRFIVYFIALSSSYKSDQSQLGLAAINKTLNQQFASNVLCSRRIRRARYVLLIMRPVGRHPEVCDATFHFTTLCLIRSGRCSVLSYIYTFQYILARVCPPSSHLRATRNFHRHSDVMASRLRHSFFMPTIFIGLIRNSSWMLCLCRLF